MCRYKTVSQIVDIFTGLEIIDGNSKLGLKIGNFEVLMGVTLESDNLSKIWDTVWKFDI